MFSSNSKIFNLSFQRTGTTSIGQFFDDFGFKVAKYDKQRSQKWSYQRLIGDYEAIFSSKDFKKNQVFEDNPWWELDFYKVLFHKFPKSKFILLTRDADKWFDSMLSHSNHKNPGNAFRHSIIYRRENEFYDKFPDEDYYKTAHVIDNRLDLKEIHREHYKCIYQNRNKAVIDFFKAFSQQSLFIGQLEDPKKWEKLADFFDFKIPENYNVHSNRTQK
jgi:hypothetical protein